MVNIRAIMYFRTNREITAFESASDFISWQISRYPLQQDRDRFDHFHNTLCKRDEKYLERKYNLETGLTSGIHLIFQSTPRVERYLVRPEILELIQDNDHVIVLEINPGNCVIATFYRKKEHFSIVHRLPYQAVGSSTMNFLSETFFSERPN